MPNWCENSLNVNGNITDVITFITDTHDTNEKGEYYFSLEKVNPTPLSRDGEELREDWYNWRNENWGTKWDTDVYSAELSTILKDESRVKCKNVLTSNEKEMLQEKLEYLDKEGYDTEYNTFFLTAWGPPIRAYDTMRSRYKDNDLEFRATYNEPGMCFAGVWGWSKGKVTENNHYADRGGDSTVDYIEFLLEEDLETTENIHSTLVECYLEEKWESEGKTEEEMNKLCDEIYDELDNAESNREEAMLYKKYIEYSRSEE